MALLVYLPEDKQQEIGKILCLFFTFIPNFFLKWKQMGVWIFLNIIIGQNIMGLKLALWAVAD